MEQRIDVYFLKWKNQVIATKCHTEGKPKCNREMLWQKQPKKQRVRFNSEVPVMVYFNVVLTEAVYSGL